jgi:SAM-dependent methyltransferase
MKRFLRTNRDLQQESIDAFGSQWARFKEIDGEFDRDFGGNWFRKLLGEFDPELIFGQRVGEIGAGIGGSTKNIVQFQPKLLVAYEPSSGYKQLERHFSANKRVKLVNASGEEFSEQDLDLIFCIGVLHHIPNPIPTLLRAISSLRVGGKLVLWVYGDQEKLYVALQQIVRRLTSRISDNALERLSVCATHVASIYGRAIKVSRVSRMPMYEYLTQRFLHLDFRSRKILMFDQLNPTWSHYYSRLELENLLTETGFTNLVITGVNRSSWSVVCEKGPPDLQH